MDYVAIVTLELNGNTYNKGDVIAPADVPTTKLRSLVDKGLIDAVNSVGDIADGSIAPAKVTGTAVVTNDARLSDTRTPTDSSVTNAKVNASAAIAVSKLAAGTNGETISTVSGVPTWASVLPADQVANVVAKSAVGNLLTANQASVETDTAGLGKEYQCTVARSTAAARVGSASLAVTCTGAGAWTAGAATNSVGYQVPVVVGQTYTGVVYTKAAATPRAMYANIRFATGGNADVSYTSGTTATNTTSGWTAYYVTAVAPATAEYAQVYMVSDVTPAANEVHYLDCLGFWQGAGGQWALPGTPITNLGFYTDESVGRRLFQWDANNSRWQMTYGDTGWRDVTSLVDTSGWTNAPTALAVYVRRTLEQSSMIAQWNPGTGSCSGQGVLTLPSGFGPAAGIIAPQGAWHSSDAGAYVGGWYWASSTEIDLQSPATSVYLRAMATLPCTAPWPTTLPGTASGSIPA